MSLTTVLLCATFYGCGKPEKIEVPPTSNDLGSTDQPPDSESMTMLRKTVDEVIQAIRNDRQQNIYELLAPDIRRAVSFYEFRKSFGVDQSNPLSLPESLPAPDFSRVHDRVAEVFIMEPDEPTSTAVHLDMLRLEHRWFLRSIVLYRSPFHSFHHSGGLISPGTTQLDLIRIKEVMLQKALLTGKDWPDVDGFSGRLQLAPDVPVYVAMDPDLHPDFQFHIPGWMVQVVPESSAIARRRNLYFKFSKVQIFGDLAVGTLTLSHPDFQQGSGIAEMWLVRSGNLWRHYMYGSQEIS